MGLIRAILLEGHFPYLGECAGRMSFGNKTRMWLSLSLSGGVTLTAKLIQGGLVGD